MAKQSAHSSGAAAHRGRLQAQGGGTEKSQKWERDTPPTKSELVKLLDTLWATLTRGEQDDRKECYVDMKKYIEQAPAGGIPAPLSKSFRNRKLRGGVRIDLEIRAGRACVDDP